MSNVIRAGGEAPRFAGFEGALGKIFIELSADKFIEFLEQRLA